MSITQGLHRSLQEDPGGVATLCGNRVRSFGEQYDRVSRLASGLLSAGARVGDRIALVCHNSDRMLETLMGAAWAGVVFAPMNTRWSADELAYAINDVQARVLVVDDGFAPLSALLRARCPELEHVLFI